VSEEPDVAHECRTVGQRTGTLHRVFDVLCAGVGLIFLSPLFLIIALAIKFDDGGPIVYRQARVGRNFQLFQICKFRSMVNGADNDGLLTAPGDSRVTRVGRWLRRYKLDELPQLLNVFKGDMQFVGARPEVERYVEMFHSQYAVILQERPGITDPASLAFRHEDQIFSADRMEQQYVEEILPAKIKLSLDYQRHRSFLTDAKILLKTILGLII
jgi:lipopolysaccharide/colanic/teichoic acid biosynthesis glycosyltransferase